MPAPTGALSTVSANVVGTITAVVVDSATVVVVDSVVVVSSTVVVGSVVSGGALETVVLHATNNPASGASKPSRRW